MDNDARLMVLARAIALGERTRAERLLARAPELAVAGLSTGASRQAASDYFLREIRRYVYRGDTALHVAAAAHDVGVVRLLIDAGAILRATNRRGAQPLHYAVDGTPGSARWDPIAQRDTVRCLVLAGADPNAADKNGTPPLLRAVRNRCAAAVEALLELGADPHATNGRGSTAVQLARWTTGRGGSGSAEARTQAAEIIRLLADAGP